MTFQAKLTTKLDNLSVDGTIVELKNDVDSYQLNHIVKSALVQLGRVSEIELKEITFDFVVGGRLLRLTIDKHLELYSDELNPEEILSEKLVEIEYLLLLDAPEPLEALPHDDWVSCVDANESHILTGSYDNSLTIFSIKNRKKLVRIEDAHEKPVTKVRWLGDIGQAKNSNFLYFVSSGHDEISILRRFNLKSLKTDIICIFSGHNRSVNCLSNQDDLLATGSFDKTLRVWSANLTEEIHEAGEETKTNGTTKKKQKTKQSEKFTGNTIRNAILTLTGHQESVTGVRWVSNNNELATCSMDRTICFWDIEVGECTRRVLSAKPLLGIDFSAENNLILSASCDRHVRIWDARAPDNATAKTVYTSHSAWVSSVAFGQNSNNFISGGYDNLVKLWDLRSPKACLYDMIGHHDKVLDINWRNPSYVLSGSADATLKVFASNDKY